MPAPRYPRLGPARTPAAPATQPKRVHLVYDVADKDVITITCDDAEAFRDALAASDRRHIVTLDVADLRRAVAAAVAITSPQHGRGAAAC
jgi:hypothetical protein